MITNPPPTTDEHSKVDMESFIAVNDETEAEAGVDIVEDLEDILSNNLEDKVNKERNERDDSYTSSVGTRASEIAVDERPIPLVLLDANVELN